MRPLPSDDVFNGRSRRTSFADSAATPTPGTHQPQMTYFMADEKTMEASIAQSTFGSSSRSLKNSRFGVESLDSTISSLTSQDSDDTEAKVDRARNRWKKGLMHKRPNIHRDDAVELGSTSPQSSPQVVMDSISDRPSHVSPKAIPSHPPSPGSHILESPLLGSTPSSPVSRRNSETDFSIDDSASQAILSSGEEDRTAESEVMDSSSALVMPSISMPRRRPFTEKGKSLGRLKILIAGDSGVGKSSLIKAIVQVCEEIVHVDQLATPLLAASEVSRKKSRSKTRTGSTNVYTTTQITEVYASTRAYPQWWSEFDEGKVLRRRKSMGDSVLERNICFVDTPGYGNGTSCMECIVPVVQYIESQIERSTSVDIISDGDLTGMLSGSGGSQVDVVFYLILHRMKPVDLEYLRRLSPLTNIIPLIAQSESLPVDQIRSLKANILSQLQEADIRPFLFGIHLDEALSISRISPPFAISTKADSDHENMDASLLMSPDYVQPLIPTELSVLIEQVFERDTAAWLRHSAAKKCMQWRKDNLTGSLNSRSLPQSLSLRSSYTFGGSLQIVTPPIGSTNSYALARISDHTQREERLAQIRLSKWATDLQRSLQNERARFEAVARGERAMWLTERLNECVQDGTLVPISEYNQIEEPSCSGALVKQGTYSRRANTGSTIDRFDPLGLLQLNTELKRKGWAILRVVGRIGIVAGIAYWIANLKAVRSKTDGWDWETLFSRI